MLITSAWRVLRNTGCEVVMCGAFAGRSAGEIFPVVSAVAKLVCEDGKAYAAYAHEALLDTNPAQVESLLSVDQSLRNPKNGIDDRARCERDVNENPGQQCSRFGTHRLPFYFDGTKCFYAIYLISEKIGPLRTDCSPAFAATSGYLFAFHYSVEAMFWIRS